MLLLIADNSVRFSLDLRFFRAPIFTFPCTGLDWGRGHGPNGKEISMVADKVKAELKRFLSPKQVEELSKQFDAYEVKVRDAVKQFDVKGRAAKAKGQEQLDKFATQVKKTGQELEKQFKTFLNQENKMLNKGLNELFAYFRTLSKAEATKPAKKAEAGAKQVKKAASSKAKSAKPAARKVRSAAKPADEQSASH
jgi:hypothetical protein